MGDEWKEKSKALKEFANNLIEFLGVGLVGTREYRYQIFIKI